jgi:hypothetical protein
MAAPVVRATPVIPAAADRFAGLTTAIVYDCRVGTSIWLMLNRARRTNTANDKKIAQESYPQVARLKLVKGVGMEIALTYVLTIEDPQRFPKSREVGCFLGAQGFRREATADAHQ